MLGRIIEIVEPNRYLSVERGFMLVYQTGSDRKEIGRVPLDDISILMGNGFGLSYSNNLIVELSERNIIFVACGSNHMPQAYLIPTVSNYEQSRRLNAQVAASLPTKKRAWAQIIKSKLQQQALVLESQGLEAKRLWRLAAEVTSGDPKNLEGQGASHYFPTLFGRTFRRNVNQVGINAMLNYGYTVMRATVARSIVIAGLHPAFGVHHQNAANPFRLADDLIEPFRPIVDKKVITLVSQGIDPVVNPSNKKLLVDCVFEDMLSQQGRTPVSSAIQDLAISLAKVYLKQQAELVLPLPKMPDKLKVKSVEI